MFSSVRRRCLSEGEADAARTMRAARGMGLHLQKHNRRPKSPKGRAMFIFSAISHHTQHAHTLNGEKLSTGGWSSPTPTINGETSRLVWPSRSVPAENRASKRKDGRI
ncbi:phosphatidylinositol 4-kinase alpha [Striga asiatica]|uniref:Phosphatidylinositol 4-kinase alpha n=1 Tax=Striga asiatica TaxID=4170 RepID=A0A5A7P851_STRAF|nr:phosphatidylinositol 4-kinase alpha [Striga asiatica]